MSQLKRGEEYLRLLQVVKALASHEKEGILVSSLHFRRLRVVIDPIQYAGNLVRIV